MPKYTENEASYEALTPENAALLLNDHLVGLLELVRDASPEEYRNNVLGLDNLSVCRSKCSNDPVLCPHPC